MLTLGHIIALIDQLNTIKSYWSLDKKKLNPEPRLHHQN